MPNSCNCFVHVNILFQFELKFVFFSAEGLILDSSSTPHDDKSNDSSHISFENSDINLTTNSINTTNQNTHQYITNHAPINQQNYSGQTIHGNQSNIAPNFNTILQTTSQPFIQNNSNTLVQNNTNLIQPINLVNFNNVNIDSLQTFLASQNNLMYLSQPSSSTTTTTVTTTTSSSSNLNPINESDQHQISIRPKPPSILAQDLPKSKSEQFDYPTRQLSTSSNGETTNLLDNDLNHKQPRPIRPKPSSRSNSLQVLAPVLSNESKSINTNILTPSLLTNTSSASTSFDEHPLEPSSSSSSSSTNQLKPADLPVPSTPKKPPPNRNRKKVPSSSSINPSLVPIAPNLGRPLAPAPLNVQRIVTTNKRSSSTKKRQSKGQTDNLLQPNSPPPLNSFAESISGLMQNFDQELIASNFLPPQPTTTANILSNDSSSNLMRTLDHIDVRHIVNTTIASSLDEFDQESHSNLQDYNVDNEQITSFMNEDEMNFVEMNFDETTFLKQFDLDDTQIKLNINSEQNLFTSLLTPSTPAAAAPPPPPIYPGSSLINNNVFTTIVPLNNPEQTSQINPPEEGVQLTARHIEPSQVATYESVKYQDILDDLVTVTDQDVLSHVQATVNETNDFSFALLEATNETAIEVPENDLQYFYPIEQEQELLQKQLEQCEQDKDLTLNDSPKAEDTADITDLTSILQINQTRSPSPIKETMDFPTLPPVPTEILPPSPITTVEAPPVPMETNSRKARILFEPILSPMQDEVVIESGRVPDTTHDQSSSPLPTQIEELLNEPSAPVENPYEIIENQGQTTTSTDVAAADNLDELIEQIEEPTKEILEKNFFHYQKVYQENLKKKPTEQYEPIPSVKLKLKSIYPKDKRESSSPSPVTICENVRPPLKIKIRTKLPSPPKQEEETQPPLPKIKIRKPIKKTKRPKDSPPSLDEQIETEAKLSLKTEYAGLTRFEQSLAQLYHQQSSPDTRIPPTPGEIEDINLHKQDTPPTAAASMNNSSSSPINSNKKLTHLLNYDDEPLNNNTFITPPPENEANIQQTKNSNQITQSPKKMKKSHQNAMQRKDYQPPPPSAPSQSQMHIDPYSQSFHPFDPQASPFFNFPFSNPFINPHSTPTPFHQNSMKYHYPTHQQSYSYHHHPHLQRQQQYNNPNYMCKCFFYLNHRNADWGFV